MSVDEQCLQLARDALYARRVFSVGSVALVSFNDASAELGEIGVEALPAIEFVIKNEICDEHAESELALRREYRGLRSVLVTYFRIVATQDRLAQRAVSFVEGLSGLIRYEALQAIWVQWLVNDESMPIPKALSHFVHKLRQSGSEQEQKWAMRFLKKYSGLHDESKG